MQSQAKPEEEMAEEPQEPEGSNTPGEQAQRIHLAGLIEFTETKATVREPAWV